MNKKQKEKDDIIRICPVCGKVDVSKKHILNCDNHGRLYEQDNYWK